MATVTLVGGSPLWQRGVASLLDEGGHETAIGSDLTSWLVGSDGSCVVMRVESGDDLGEIATFREEHTHVPLVAVLDEVDVAGVAAAMRSGASAVTGVNETPEMVSATVAGALDGLVVLPARIVSAMARRVPDNSNVSAWLSDDEAGWLRAMAAGQTVADIADDVGYSERAMFRQLKTLYQRLGVRNRTEALLWAGRNGVLEPA
ncbi:MAG: LuxR C-terminal-related transcriptional regulator [Acidimicrobiia bacterium]|jgi:DNA-binding NarL/FixJ family response regulator